MTVAHRHLPGVVWIVVVVFLGLAAGFVIDAVTTNTTYDRLAAHHVTVSPRTRVCLQGMCGMDYDYRGTRFGAAMLQGQDTAFVVDPGDPSVRMSLVAFESGPGGTVVDTTAGGKREGRKWQTSAW